jgi:hypothetical protein
VRRGKAKIGFEVDADDLANAKAFVAKHGGSLNKLVSALFASLGREAGLGPPVADPALGLPQPRLPKEFVNQQLNLARGAPAAWSIPQMQARNERSTSARCAYAPVHIPMPHFAGPWMALGAPAPPHVKYAYEQSS